MQIPTKVQTPRAAADTNAILYQVKESKNKDPSKSTETSKQTKKQGKRKEDNNRTQNRFLVPGTHQIYGIKALQRNLFLKQLINIYPAAGWSLLLFDTPCFLFTTTSGLKRKLKYINWGFWGTKWQLHCYIFYKKQSRLRTRKDNREAVCKDRRCPKNLLHLSLFSSRYKQGPRVQRYTALPRHTSTGGHVGTQPGEPVWRHWDGQQGGRSSCTNTALCLSKCTWYTDTVPRQRQLTTSQRGEQTEDSMSPCLLCTELQSLTIPFWQPSTGLCPTVHHSRYRQTLADFWNCKQHFHMYTDSSKLLLLGSASSNCHLKWVPGYKMPTSAVSDAGIFLPRPHPRRNSGSYGKMVGYKGAGSTPPASRLTVPPALPRYKPMPEAGLHQVTEAGLCLFCFLAGHIERQSHVLRIQAWSTCHRLYKWPQTSYSLSLCVCSRSVRMGGCFYFARSIRLQRT